MISHILVKSKAKLVSLQNPGQPMGWLGWPVATTPIQTSQDHNDLTANRRD